MEKKKLLVSFSGGETSGYMAQWLWNNKRHEYDMVFVFANTGEENEETLEFAQKCSDYFGFPLVWVEGVYNETVGIGTTHKVVDFGTANRCGEPFRQMIKKHGIPNQNFPHCSRELKNYPITSYIRTLGAGWQKNRLVLTYKLNKKKGYKEFKLERANEYYTAIGIRVDEFDRMADNYKQNRFIYPLISEKPMDKQRINFWWSQQPFRLKLKGYEGNCKWCWKKYEQKLYMIAKEAPERFCFPAEMERLYENFVPKARIEKQRKKGKEIAVPLRFFRNNMSVADIMEGAKNMEAEIVDDSKNKNYQMFIGEETESCDAFTQCGT